MSILTVKLKLVYVDNFVIWLLLCHRSDFRIQYQLGCGHPGFRLQKHQMINNCSFFSGLVSYRSIAFVQHFLHGDPFTECRACE
jgi:hypothetical protein